MKTGKLGLSGQVLSMMSGPQFGQALRARVHRRFGLRRGVQVQEGRVDGVEYDLCEHVRAGEQRLPSLT